MRKRVKNFIIIDVVFYLILIYILGCTSLKTVCFEKGMISRLLYYMIIIILASLCSYLSLQYTQINNWMEQYSFERYKTDLIRRYNLRKIDVILLLPSIIIGSMLRLLGNSWGITSIFQPDECKLVNPVIEMSRGRYLYSSSFYYPNQFTSKIAAIITCLYGKYTGIPIDGQMIQAYFINRYVVASFSIGIIILAFLIGNYFEVHLGVITAWLVALYPIYILLSKQVTGDTTVFFFLLFLLLFSLRYIETKRNVFIWLMSMSTALATLEKWHGAIGCAYIAVVIMVNSKCIKECIRRGMNALVSYIISMVILAPNMMFQLRSAIINGFINIAVYDDREHPPYLQQMKDYISQSMYCIAGIVFLVLLILGIIYWIRNFRKEYVIFSLGILKLLVLCFMNRGFFRWGLELYFDFLLLSAMGIYMIFRSKHCWSRLIGVLLALILTLDFGTDSFLEMIIAMRSEQDTRLLQEEFCDTHGITLDNSLSEYYTGFVPGGWVSKKGKVSEADLNDCFVIEQNSFYKTQDVEYVIVNLARGNKQMHTYLEENASVVQRFDGVIPDIFWGGGLMASIEDKWSDLEIISTKIRIIQAVLNGENTGWNIVIYDIRDIPVKY